MEETNFDNANRIALGTLIWRCLRLRCPLCGRGKLFCGLFRMHERCSHCDCKYEREAGFFLGSIYFNYGVTAISVVVAYPLLKAYRPFPDRWISNAVLAFVVLFPIWFFRYARSLWLGFDQFIDPRPSEEK